MPSLIFLGPSYWGGNQGTEGQEMPWVFLVLRELQAFSQRLRGRESLLREKVLADGLRSRGWITCHLTQMVVTRDTQWRWEHHWVLRWESYVAVPINTHHAGTLGTSSSL